MGVLRCSEIFWPEAPATLHCPLWRAQVPPSFSPLVFGVLSITQVDFCKYGNALHWCGMLGSAERLGESVF